MSYPLVYFPAFKINKEYYIRRKIYLKTLHFFLVKTVYDLKIKKIICFHFPEILMNTHYGKDLLFNSIVVHGNYHILDTSDGFMFFSIIPIGNNSLHELYPWFFFIFLFV